MWQSLDMNELAKDFASAPVAQHDSAFFKQLRDFSIRKLSDEMVEILGAEIQEDGKENDENEDIPLPEDAQVDAPEMAPFSLEDPPEKENEPQPELDLEAIRFEAFASGQEAAREEYALEREKLVEAHAKALDEMRQTTINTMAGDLVAMCQACFDQLQCVVEKHVAQLMAPLIGEKLERQAIAEFTRQLANEAMETTLPLVIEGQPALLDAFVAYAKKSGQINLAHYHFEAREGSELRISYEDRMLSTRIQPLLQKLREII